MSSSRPQHPHWVLTATILTSGLGFFMGSAVNVALPTIQRFWDLDISVVQWIANGYALTLSSFILLSGSLGDLFGVRRLFNTGILIFTGGAALCAVAPTPALLISFRAVQGLGAAIMVPGSLAIINRLFPESERGRVIGLWAGISGAIAALGPFFGGVLVELSWRLLFWFAVPLGVAASVITSRYLPALKEGGNRRVDWGGAAAVLLALGGFSYGLVRIPEVGLNPYTLTGLALGLSAALSFVPLERRATNPIVPFSMLGRTVAVANIVTILIYFSFQGTFFLLSFVFQQLLGYSASFTGVAFLPATVMIALFAAPSGTLTDRWGPRRQLILGPSVLAIALLLMILGAETTPFLTYWLPVVVLFGAGMVLIVPAVTKAALLVDERHAGAASGLNNAAARTAGLLAITVLGAVINGRYQAALPGLLPAALPEEAAATIIDEAGRLLSAPLPETVPEALRESVIEARRAAFARASRAALGVTGSAAVASAALNFALFPKISGR